MTAADEGKLDPALVASLYLEHGEELRRFLLGVLREPQLAADVLQTALARMIERGHEVQAESRKAWLFRVAYHEALAVRRREALGQHKIEQASWLKRVDGPAADEQALRYETVQRVQAALAELSEPQREVVRLRMYENKTFAEIAQLLGIPLGTALGRMRQAIERLRTKLQDPDVHDL